MAPKVIVARRDKRMARALSLIAADVEFAALVTANLNRVLPLASPNRPLGMELVARAEELFFGVKLLWETPDPSLSPFVEPEAAASYLVAFFAPLLSTTDVAAELRTGKGFGLPVPGSLAPRMSGLVASASYVSSARAAFAPVLDKLREAIEPAFEPFQLDRLANAIAGTVSLVTLPIWTVYHHFHGSVALTVVEPRMRAAINGYRSALDDLYRDIARPTVLDDRVVQLSTESQRVLGGTLNVLHGLLISKSAALERYRVEVEGGAPRERPLVDGLAARLQSVPIWRADEGSTVTLGIGNPPDDDTVRLFPYLGQLEFEGPEKVHDRSFWAPPESWEALVGCCRLVSQAGFVVVVTAASNARGGRHPPHQTHRSGLEFDLDWGFTHELWNGGKGKVRKGKVRNLARQSKLGGQGPYVDLETNEHFELVPAKGDNRPTTHVGIEKIATLAVFQALALAGLPRYLYVDVQNQRLAGNYLALAIDPVLAPERGRRANIPVAEGLAHFNHVHAERIPRQRPFLAASNLSQRLGAMFRLALIRDAHAEFQRELMMPPKDADKETQERVAAFGTAWLKRSQDGLPALLPVWLSSEEFGRRLLGE